MRSCLTCRTPAAQWLGSDVILVERPERLGQPRRRASTRLTVTITSPAWSHENCHHHAICLLFDSDAHLRPALPAFMQFTNKSRSDDNSSAHIPGTWYLHRNNLLPIAPSFPALPELLPGPCANKPERPSYWLLSVTMRTMKHQLLTNL